MQDDPNSKAETPNAGSAAGPKPDMVEQANDDSFPASDPPAWNSARAGRPEGQAQKESRRDDQRPTLPRCEAIALFAGQAQAHAAADELLAAGLASVHVGPPRQHGNLAAGLGAVNRRDHDALTALCAGVGVAAAILGGAFVGRRPSFFAAGAGALLGAVAGYGAGPRLQSRNAGVDGWPSEGACLLRVEVKSAEDERRVLLTAEKHGARSLRLQWNRDC